MMRGGQQRDIQRAVMFSYDQSQSNIDASHSVMVENQESGWGADGRLVEAAGAGVTDEGFEAMFEGTGAAETVDVA